jgi:hypothetical protein
MTPGELIDHLNEETEFLAEFRALQSDVDCLVSSETTQDIGSNIDSIGEQLRRLQNVAKKLRTEFRKQCSK